VDDPAIDDLPLPTLQTGTVGPGVVVLNDIPRLTTDDLALAAH